MKVASHNKGQIIDPDAIDDAVGGEDECRAFFRRLVPGLAVARLCDTRVCVYNNTPDDDFIIDWHPDLKDVLIATGFSGHGFKFGPLVGLIAADLIDSGKTDYEIARFSLSRLERK
jgi:glycine/D-amino acid oxidase-like deaminating enzyme